MTRSMEGVGSLCLWAALLLGTAVACTIETPTSHGTEFILGFMQNEHVASDVELIITTLSCTPANVTVTTPLFDPSWSKTVIVTRDDAQLVLLHGELRGSGIEKSDKGILVQSTKKISVYAVNNQIYTTDGHLVLPVDVLGLEHYAMSINQRTELMVVATQNDTLVSVKWPTSNTAIDFSFDGKRYRNGDTLNLTLNRFETFHAMDSTSTADFTGTHIFSSKPIVVLSGSRLAAIGGGAADHLAEMMTPVDTWGTRYISTNTPDRDVGDIFRILASEDDTLVNFSDGTSESIAKAGDFKDVDLNSGSYQVIISNKPVLITMFSKYVAGDGEPSMTTIVPESQYGCSSNWLTVTNSAGQPEFRNKVTVIIEKKDMSGLQLDGNPVTWDEQTDVLGSSKIHLWAHVTPGFHRLTHADPCVTYMTWVSGTAFSISYAYITNMDLPKQRPAEEDCAPQPTHNCTEMDFIPENGTDTCVCSVDHLGTPPGILTWTLRNTTVATGGDEEYELLLPSLFLTRQYDRSQLVCQVNGTSSEVTMLPLNIAYGPDKVDLVESVQYDVNTGELVTIFYCRVTGMNPVRPDMVQWEGPCQPNEFTCTMDQNATDLHGESVKCLVTNHKNVNNVVEDIKPIETVPTSYGVGMLPVLGTLMATNLLTALCCVVICCYHICHSKTRNVGRSPNSRMNPADHHSIRLRWRPTYSSGINGWMTRSDFPR